MTENVLGLKFWNWELAIRAVEPAKCAELLADCNKRTAIGAKGLPMCAANIAMNDLSSASTSEHLATCALRLAMCAEYLATYAEPSAMYALWLAKGAKRLAIRVRRFLTQKYINDLLNLILPGKP